MQQPEPKRRPKAILIRLYAEEKQRIDADGRGHRSTADYVRDILLGNSSTPPVSLTKESFAALAAACSALNIAGEKLALIERHFDDGEDFVIPPHLVTDSTQKVTMACELITKALVELRETLTRLLDEANP